MTEISPAHSKTTHANGALSQNRNGSNTAKVNRSRNVASNCPGQELADPVDLRHLVHRLTGRVALEIIERQSQQPAEQMQVEFGVKSRADHRNDRPPSVVPPFDHLIRSSRATAQSVASSGMGAWLSLGRTVSATL